MSPSSRLSSLNVAERLRPAAWAVGALGALLGTLGLLRAIADHTVSPLTTQGVSGALLCVLAAVILDHRPANRAAWALLLSGVLVTTLSVVHVWSAAAIGSGSAGHTTLANLLALDILAGESLVLFLLLFPTGHLPSRRWLPVLWLYVVGWVGSTTAVWFAARSIDGSQVEGYLDQFAASYPGPAALEIAVNLAGLAFLVAGIVSIAVRLRGAGTTERAQLLWVLWGFGLTVLVMAVTSAMSGAPKILLPLLTPIPLFVCIVIAMRRHRLFDVERLVRRTVTYAAIVVLLVALYAAVVVGTGAMVGGRFGSSVGVAAATLAVALAFRPVARVVRGQVDRRFDQRTWQAVQAIENFTARLRGGDASPADVIEAIRGAVGDPTATVAFVDDGDWIDVDGNSVDWSPVGPDRFRLDVNSGGACVAMIDLDQRLAAEPRLVSGTMSAAALALENAALHARAAARLTEVRDSRSRIVLAEDEQRRRIERDLHDGAQQRLVGLALKLRMAEREVAATDQQAAATLAEAVQELRDTVEELRDLTRGLLPPVLAEEGLAVALRHAAARLPLPVRLDIPSGRLPTAVETACWFVACEGMANTVKHADASAMRIGLDRLSDRVVLRVTDDGVGGANARAGGGLEGLADRVATLGGTLRVTSSAGAGTTIGVAIPCEF